LKKLDSISYSTRKTREVNTLQSIMTNKVDNQLDPDLVIIPEGGGYFSRNT
jgi:hypothetical protein